MFVLKTVTLEVGGSPVKIWAGEQVTDQGIIDALATEVPPIALNESGGFWDQLTDKIAAMRARGTSEAECESYIYAAIFTYWD